MDEPVARAARTGPEVARALREEPEVDSVSPAAAPAGGAVSLAQFQAENSDCTNVRLGVQKLGLRRALPVPSSRHGKREKREREREPFTIFTILNKNIWSSFSRSSNSSFITVAGDQRYAFSGIIFILETFILKIWKTWNKTFWLYTHYFEEQLATYFIYYHSLFNGRFSS